MVRRSRGRYRGGGQLTPPEKIPDAEVRRLRAAIWALIDAFEAAAAHHEWKMAGGGGQHVSYHGDFASMTPSGVSQMRRWARDLRSALKNEWPMLREEFVEHYGAASGEALDEMFKEREP